MVLGIDRAFSARVTFASDMGLRPMLV
jgi:hypothetical protein